MNSQSKTQKSSIYFYIKNQGSDSKRVFFICAYVMNLITMEEEFIKCVGPHVFLEDNSDFIETDWMDFNDPITIEYKPNLCIVAKIYMASNSIYSSKSQKRQQSTIPQITASANPVAPVNSNNDQIENISSVLEESKSQQKLKTRPNYNVMFENQYRGSVYVNMSELVAAENEQKTFHVRRGEHGGVIPKLHLVVSLDRHVRIDLKAVLTDIKRLYPVGRTRFSRHTRIYVPFVIIGLLLALLEPVRILCRFSSLGGLNLVLGLVDQVLVCLRHTYEQHSSLFDIMQLWVLFLSSAWFLLDMVIVTAFMPSELTDSQSNFIRKIGEFEYVLHCFTGEILFEGLFLAVGWVTLVFYEGISAIRCFRLLRFIWYISQLEADEDDYFLYSTIQSFRWCALLLGALTHEFYWRITRSRGIGVVLLLFLYISYVTGAVSWAIVKDLNITTTNQLTSKEELVCDGVDRCMFLVMRLAVLDKEGLDFIRILMDFQGSARKSWILAVMLFVYLFVSSFMLLYGIIGLMRSIILGIDVKQFEAQELDEDNAQLMEELQESEHKRDIHRFLTDLKKNRELNVSSINEKISELRLKIQNLNDHSL